MNSKSVGHLISDPRERLEHQARVKALKRLWGKGRTKPKGKRDELLEFIKQGEITLGHGSVRLDHHSVREYIELAIKENDWHSLYLLSRWHEKERKPLQSDALSDFMLNNWEACQTAKDGWTGLRDLDDQGIALWAKAERIHNRAFGRGAMEGQSAVRERRLKFRLERTGDPRFTFRSKGGKIVLQKLAQ